MNKRERGNYTGKYEVLGDVELVGEEAVEAERQIAQADSESKLRQTHFASGFDAGRASAQAAQGSNGMPAVCYRCGKPAVTFINTSVNMASSVPSHMEAVCDDHNPYTASTASQASAQAEIAHLKDQLTAARMVVEAARMLITSSTDESLIEYGEAFDNLERTIAALDAVAT